MDEKIKFVTRSMKGGNFGQLCREFKISRKTGYKWQQRFIEGGLGGLEDRSRRPEGHQAELKEEVVCEIIRLKNAHPCWGPKKIRELYARRHKGQLIASESSFKRVLERAGLTEKRRRKRSKETGRLCSGRKAEAPNEVWTVDFKGWWLGCHGERIEPLTVRDEYSRMILDIRLVNDGTTETVQACFIRLFGMYGLPKAIRSDNGSPFASSHGLLGLSRLSVWFLALGIDLERGRPGRPQDNGAHERMHLDIYRELQKRKVPGIQESFDLWREEYNTERPHESLGMQFPAEVYKPSERRYEGTPEELEYELMEKRRVNKTNGMITFEGMHISISMSLGGWDVGLLPQPGGKTEVWFARLLLGHIDHATESFEPIRTGEKNAEVCHSADSATLRRPNGKRKKTRRQPTQKVLPAN